MVITMYFLITSFHTVSQTHEITLSASECSEWLFKGWIITLQQSVQCQLYDRKCWQHQHKISSVNHLELSEPKAILTWMCLCLPNSNLTLSDLLLITTRLCQLCQWDNFLSLTPSLILSQHLSLTPSLNPLQCLSLSCKHACIPNHT